MQKARFVHLIYVFLNQIHIYLDPPVLSTIFFCSLKTQTSFISNSLVVFNTNTSRFESHCYCIIHLIINPKQNSQNQTQSQYLAQTRSTDTQ